MGEGGGGEEGSVGEELGEKETIVILMFKRRGLGAKESSVALESRPNFVQ